MRKHILHCLVLGLLLMFLLPTAVLASGTESGSEGRTYETLAGSKRYNTACEVAVTAWNMAHSEAPETIIMVKGDNFPDALTANALAGYLDAPILMTSSTGLSGATSELLSGSWKGVSRIVFVGGGFSQKVYDSLKAIKDFELDTTSFVGEKRYETAEKVANFLLENDACDTVIVATGDKAADALAVSPLSYGRSYPILLAKKSGEIRPETEVVINDDKVKHVILLGGTGAVADSAACGKDMVRLGGENRYETCQKIAEYCCSEDLGFTMTDRVGFAHASDDHYPDALVGGQLLGRSNSVMILVGDSDGKIKSVGSYISDKMGGEKSNGSTFYFLGYVGKGSDNYIHTVRAIENVNFYKAPTVKFETKYSGGQDYAVLTAKDDAGKTVWTKTTGKYGRFQLPNVGNIGQFGDRYYYTEQQTLFCLNALTGKQLWSKKETVTYGPAADFDANGNIYVVFYIRNTLYKISPNGDVLKSAVLDGRFGKGYLRPYKLDYNNGTITVTYEQSLSGPNQKITFRAGDVGM